MSDPTQIPPTVPISPMTPPAVAETVPTTPVTPARSLLGTSTLPTPATTTTPDIKPGPRTTEFWLTVASIVAATVLLLTHHITPTEWTTMTGGVAGIYAIIRTYLKLP